jgi:exosortase/archaeosortase family protein
MVKSFFLIGIEIYSKNKYFIQFLAKSLIIYFTWSFLYHSVLVSWGINDPLTGWVASGANKICQVFDSKIHLKIIDKKNFIYLGDRPLVFIDDPCNGLELYVLFIAFYVAIGKLLYSIKWMFFGIIGIFILNVARISGLAWVVLYRPADLDFHHKYTFALVVYSWILLVWVFSLQKK